MRHAGGRARGSSYGESHDARSISLLALLSHGSWGGGLEGGDSEPGVPDHGEEQAWPSQAPRCLPVLATRVWSASHIGAPRRQSRKNERGVAHVALLI